MQHRVVVNLIVIIPDQVVVLSLVVVEYRTVIMPAHLRGVVRLDIPLLKTRRSDGQPLERDVNRTLDRDGLTIIDKSFKATDMGLTDSGSTASPVRTLNRLCLFAVSASLDVVDIFGLSSDKALSIAELVCWPSLERPNSWVAGGGPRSKI